MTSKIYPGSVSMMTSRRPTPIMEGVLLIAVAAFFIVTVCLVTFLEACKVVVDPVGDVVDIRRPYTS